MSTMRLALLTRVWTHIPSLVDESRRALAAYDGGDFLDVGAFHGWYSVLLAPRAQNGARLVSFEPDPRALPKLRAVLEDVQRQFPSRTFSIIDQPVGDGGLVSASWPSASHPTYSADSCGSGEASLTIDEVVAREGLRPRLIKIDVEGAEPFVLRGMHQTLREHRPVVILELHTEWLPDGLAPADVEAYLREPGYHLAASEDGPVLRQVWQAASAAIATQRDATARSEG